MSQNPAILDYLRSGGHLNPMEALHKFGTWALSSRISELNKIGIKEGFHIKKKMVTSNNKTYAEYYLDPTLKIEAQPTGQFSFA